MMVCFSKEKRRAFHIYEIVLVIYKRIICPTSLVSIRRFPHVHPSRMT